MLKIANIARSLGNVAVFVIHSMYLDLFWLAQLLKTFPSLLFLTAYSVFIYFFGKLTSYEERSYNIAKPLLIGLNVLAYISYVFIAILCKWSAPNS